MIFVISGPGGAGKGTVASLVVARDDRLWLSRSWTTRAPRLGEDPGAYVFVDRPTFEKAIAEGRFLEHAEFEGALYGTPIPAPPPGSDVLLEIDVQGARQVREKFPEAVVILLVAPSEQEQAKRLRGRGDSEQAIARRIEKGALEVAELRTMADHVVVNDDANRAAGEIVSIVEAHRLNR